MCIIAVKPRGVELPSDEVLRNCFLNNPDGAGFMFLDKGNKSVQILKGFMKYKDFKRTLDKYSRIIDTTETPMVFHFRIGTQGGNTKANTHPFPITDDMDQMTAIRTTAKVGLVHNGVIDLTSDYTYYSAYSYEKWDYGHGTGKASKRENPDAKYSDTMLFIRDYASLIIGNNPLYYENKRTVKLLERLADSKLAILSNNGHIEMVGTFIPEDDGCFYSNSTYMKRVTSKTTKVEKGTSALGKANKEVPKDDGFFTKNVMLVPQGGYITHQGYFYEADRYDFYIDSKREVYVFSYGLDGLIQLNGGLSNAYLASGAELPFDENQSEILDVLTDTEVYWYVYSGEYYGEFNDDFLGLTTDIEGSENQGYLYDRYSDFDIEIE